MENREKGTTIKMPYFGLYDQPMPIRDDWGPCRICSGQLAEFRTIIQVSRHHIIDKFERRCEQCGKAASVAYHDYRTGSRAQNEARWWKKIADRAKVNADA